MKVKEFLDYLNRVGRSPGTIALYERHLRFAEEHPRGPLGRVTDRSLAPNTRRTALAILKSYAKFAADISLQRDLAEVKIPSFTRLRERPPIPTDKWKKLRRLIDTTDQLSEPQRAVLGMMANRGFRVGDTLRIKRTEVLSAIRSGTLILTAKGERRLKFPINKFESYLKILAKESGWEYVYDLISRSKSESPQRSATVAVQRKIRLLGQQVGIDEEFLFAHNLRRTLAVEYLKASGGDINKLKKFFQWESIETASRYVDYLDDDLEDIAEDI